MSDKDLIKKQRDRFVAFAFASADLFVEVSHEGTVTYVNGAAKAITGIDHASLEKRNWMDIFSPYEHTKVQYLFHNTRPGARCGPIIVTLSDDFGGQAAVLTGIKMPGISDYYLTLGFSNDLMKQISVSTTTKSAPEMLDSEPFLHLAQSVIRTMQEDGEDPYLTFIDLTQINSALENIDARLVKTLLSSLESIVLMHSLHESIAGNIDKNTLALIHTKALFVSSLQNQMDQAYRRIILQENSSTGPDNERETLFGFKTLLSTLNTIDKNTTIQAVSTAVSAYKTKRDSYPFETLQDALDAFKKARPVRLKALNSSVKRLGFNMHFQAVLNQKTLEEHHYEVLCRFEDETPTAEWIALIESEGKQTMFDQAMIELVINYIGFKGAETHKKLSINIFAESLLDKAFIKKINALIKKHSHAARRLYLEINATKELQNLQATAQSIRDLKSMGFGIILDGISPLKNDFSSILPLQPDLIKTDISSGAIHAMTDYKKTEVLSNFLQQCVNEHVDVCVKNIHDKNTLDIAVNAGATLLQGMALSIPTKKPVIKKEEE